MGPTRMQFRSLTNLIAVIAAAHALVAVSPVVAGPIPPSVPSSTIFGGPMLLVLDNSDSNTDGANQGVLGISTHDGTVTRLLDHTAIFQAQVDAGIPSGDINFEAAGSVFTSAGFLFVERASDSIMLLGHDGTLSVHIKKTDFPSAAQPEINLKGLAIRTGNRIVVANDDDDPDADLKGLWEFDLNTPGIITEIVDEAALVSGNGGNPVNLDGGLTSDSMGNLFLPSRRRRGLSPVPNSLLKVDSNNSVSIRSQDDEFEDLNAFLVYDSETGNIIVADTDKSTLFDVAQDGEASELFPKADFEAEVGSNRNPLAGGLAFGTLGIPQPPTIKVVQERRLFVADSGSDSILAIDTSVSPAAISVFLSRSDIASQIDYLPGALPEFDGGISFVPEPSSLFLMGMAGMTAWGWNRRKRRQGRTCRKSSLMSSTQTTV